MGRGCAATVRVLCGVGCMEGQWLKASVLTCWGEIENRSVAESKCLDERQVSESQPIPPQFLRASSRSCDSGS